MNADDEAEQHDDPPVKSKLGWRTRLWVLKLQAKEVWLRATARFVYWRIRRRCQAWKTSVVSMSRAEAERCRLIGPDDADRYMSQVDATISFGDHPLATRQEAREKKLTEFDLQTRKQKLCHELSKPVEPDTSNLEWQQIQERLVPVAQRALDLRRQQEASDQEHKPK